MQREREPIRHLLTNARFDTYNGIRYLISMTLVIQGSGQRAVLDGADSEAASKYLPSALHAVARRRLDVPAAAKEGATFHPRERQLQDLL